MPEINSSPTLITYDSDPALPPGGIDIAIPDRVTTVDTALDSGLAQQFNVSGEYQGKFLTSPPDGTVSDTEAGVTPTQVLINDNPGAQVETEMTVRAKGEQTLVNRDWRVRISLAKGADYLYNAKDAGILSPLAATDGVIFPYTPQIQLNYAATYDPTVIAHSNYRIFQYQGSGIENITITGTFTAQDVNEATYLLAVIHFFRSATKMFYGQDDNPKPGTPPPLCFLHGLGTFQFDNHPLVISNFSYTLPDDVDYIRAGTAIETIPGTPTAQPKDKPESPLNALQSIGRLIQNLSQFKLGKGGESQPPVFIQPPPGQFRVENPTYIPTRIQIVITALPVVSRNDISSKFSLRDYGTGKLLPGSNRGGAGIW